MIGARFDTPLSAEHRGMAREFRQRIANEDPPTERAMDKIYVPLRRMMLRQSVARPGVLAEAARAWCDDIPTVGRLALEVETRGKSHLVIRELRLSGATLTLSDWDDATEPGVAVLLVGLSINRRHLEVHHVLLAVVGIHAIGRFYQRSLDNSYEALTQALKRMASPADGVSVADGAGFSCSVPGGRWVGLVKRQGDQPVLAARTFLAG